MAIPERVRWAVDQLAVAPSDEVLEIGCGVGTAVALVSQRLTTGHIVAIDRSASAIERARLRNADHDTATLLQAGLAELDLVRSFDKIFAINVNVFWVGPAATELRVIRDHLRPGGALHLFYEPPAPDRVVTVAQSVQEALTTHGFSAVTTFAPSMALCAVRAQIEG